MEQISFTIIGFTAGTLGTILGLGGGFIAIPFLLLVYHFSPQQIAGTSLVMVFLNSFSGSLAYMKQKRIDFQSAWKFALATLPGSIAGSYLSRYFTSQTFAIVFGLIMILLAISIFMRGEKQNPERIREIEKEPTEFWSKLSPRHFVDAMGIEYSYGVKEPLGILISFFVGILSSALGIGGGVVHVPAMLYLLNFPTHIATATSHMILAISSLWGSAAHLYLGNVNIKVALFLGIGATIGAQVGAFLSKKIKGGWIVKFLAIALILTGFRLVFM